MILNEVYLRPREYSTNKNVIRARNWYKHNPNKRRESLKKWRNKNREYQKIWREQNSNKNREINRRADVKLNFEVINHYSNGTMKCALCSENRFIILAIDHINGNGRRHRKIVNCGSSRRFRQWIRINNYPTGYRVLCPNCNWKEYLRTRIINLSQTHDAIWKRERYILLKTSIISKLGNRCMSCGKDDLQILTIHHKHHNGTEHERQVGGGAGILYDILKRKNYEDFECLCFSCMIMNITNISIK